MKEIRMSEKELKRVEAVERVIKGEISIREMSEMINMSYRQSKRIVSRRRKEGLEGLCHRNRGKPSNRRYKEDIRSEVKELYEGKCKGWGPTHISDKYYENKGVRVSDETIRQWMLKDGAEYRKRKSKKHLSWRERKRHFGEMVQIDGSFEKWLKGEERECLLVMIDDATSKRMAMLCKEETTRDAIILLKKWVMKYGVPKAIYADYKNVYLLDKKTKRRLEEKGEETETQFGKVCRKLGIEIIGAHSPQAKGRVERANGVFQDRFIKELEYRDIKTIEEANQFLEERYLDFLNDKFSVEAESEVDYHRKAPSEKESEMIFAIEEERMVSNDWTVRYEGKIYQILNCNKNLPPVKSKIKIITTLEGKIKFIYRDWEMETKEIFPKEKRGKEEEALRKKKKKKHIPSANHPWKRDFFLSKRAEERK